MGRLIEVHDISEFSRVVAIPDAAISDTILSKVAKLHEINELEKFIRQIIYDPTETPHGPTEIADILTSHIHIRGEKRLAGFVLKGKSFQKVKSRDVTHQFAKLRTVPDLGVMIFGAVGHIQDDAQRDFIQAALDENCDYLILNAHQCSRLLIAYEKICPQDGTPFDDTGACGDGHRLDDGISLNMTVREKVRYTITKLDDVSHGGAKRYSAVVVLDRHYPRDVVKQIVQDVTEQLKHSRYYRNEQTKARWGSTSAHAVWLFVGSDVGDTQNANWVCRSCWIDPSMPKDMRPLGLDGNDRIGEIHLDWNEQYESMKDFFEENQATKGEFLDRLQPITHEMILFGKEAVGLFRQYQQEQISEAELIRTMQALEQKVRELDRQAGDLPFSPADCKDFDQACQNLFATVDNMFLYYSEQGRTKWERPNRDWLMQDTIKRFNEDLQQIEFEEKKIH